jgi:CDP-diacylglycerol--glycerol-3-phosphate 3-phosphatidyltransferase
MTNHVPNLLTVARILLAPLFAWTLFNGSNVLVPLVIFLIAALTDLADGWWARKYQLISDFGKIADPIADKALTGVAWIGLSYLGQIPWIATVVILIREIGITVLRLAILNKRVVPADRGGKWKTTLQIVTICAFIVGVNGVIPIVTFVLLWATVAMTTVTGIRYVVAIAKASS